MPANRPVPGLCRLRGARLTINNLTLNVKYDYIKSMIQANSLQIPLKDESVQCVVTSPPYWGLRDYSTATWEGGKDGCDHRPPQDAGSSKKQTAGQREHAGRFSGSHCWKCGAKRTDNQLGLEKTPEEYIENTVTWAREVWRVLRSDGTFWLNLGDSYAASGPTGGAGKQHTNKGSNGVRNRKAPDGLKPKDLCGIPWKVAFALQAGFSQCQNCGLELRTDLWPIWNGHKVCFDCRDVDKNVIIQSQQGWYLRSAMPWIKRNPMPESCTDRPASALEYMFLLTKSSKYYFDMDAIRIKYTKPLNRYGGDKKKTSENLQDGSYYASAHRDRDMRPNENGRNFRNTDLFYQSLEEPHGAIFAGEEMVGLDVNPQPYSEAHFATFPEKLVEPCIKAGTSEKGACPECGAPWERVVERTEGENQEWAQSNNPSRKAIALRGEKNTSTSKLNRGSKEDYYKNSAKSKTIGWQPTCSHKAEPVPCIVLDPFGGSGTTKNVADRLGRRGVMCELKMEYIEMAKKRCYQLPSLF